MLPPSALLDVVNYFRAVSDILSYDDHNAELLYHEPTNETKYFKEHLRRRDSQMVGNLQLVCPALSSTAKLLIHC